MLRKKHCKWKLPEKKCTSDLKMSDILWLKPHEKPVGTIDMLILSASKKCSALAARGTYKTRTHHNPKELSYWSPDYSKLLYELYKVHLEHPFTNESAIFYCNC